MRKVFGGSRKAEGTMKFTIITVNRNNKEAFRQTLESVFSQTCADYESVVIDGASTDGSAEVMRQYESQIAYGVSEPDKGVYDAMNKAIAHATGDYILFLNSGDVFADADALQRVADRMTDTDFVFAENLLTECGHSMRKRLPDRLPFRFFLSDNVCHQSSFIRRELFSEIGLYDTRYKLVADWAFFMDALFLRKKSYCVVHTVVSVYDMTGMSSRSENQDILRRERAEIMTKNFSDYLPESFFSVSFRYYIFCIRRFVDYKCFGLRKRFL